MIRSLRVCSSRIAPQTGLPLHNERNLTTYLKLFRRGRPPPSYALGDRNQFIVTNEVIALINASTGRVQMTAIFPASTKLREDSGRWQPARACGARLGTSTLADGISSLVGGGTLKTPSLPSRLIDFRDFNGFCGTLRRAQHDGVPHTLASKGNYPSHVAQGPLPSLSLTYLSRLLCFECHTFPRMLSLI